MEKSKFFETQNCYVVMTLETTHYISMDSSEQWDDHYYNYPSWHYNNYYYYYYCNYDDNYDNYDNYYYTLLNTNPNYTLEKKDDE